MDVGRHAVDRYAGQLGQRFLEQDHIAGQKRPQQHSGRELSALTKMPHQRSHFVVTRIGSERHRRLFARFPCSKFGMLRLEPLPRCHETSQHLGQLRQKSLPHWGRQIVSCQKILADRCQVAEAFDDAVNGE